MQKETIENLRKQLSHEKIKHYITKTRLAKAEKENANLNSQILAIKGQQYEHR